jgi:hypothetical protein
MYAIHPKDRALINVTVIAEIQCVITFNFSNSGFNAGAASIASHLPWHCIAKFLDAAMSLSVLGLHDRSLVHIAAPDIHKAAHKAH